MSKDYKRPEPKSRSSGSSLLIGILIGLVLGLGIALAVAWYINKMPSPFLNRIPPKERIRQGSAGAGKRRGHCGQGRREQAAFRLLQDPARNRGDRHRSAVEGCTEEVNRGGQGIVFPPGWRFPECARRGQSQGTACAARGRGNDTDDTLPDKGVWHRVRVGPYTSVEELNRTRDTLKQNGVETALIKVRE